MRLNERKWRCSLRGYVLIHSPTTRRCNVTHPSEITSRGWCAERNWNGRRNVCEKGAYIISPTTRTRFANFSLSTLRYPWSMFYYRDWLPTLSRFFRHFYHWTRDMCVVLFSVLHSTRGMEKCERKTYNIICENVAIPSAIASQHQATNISIHTSIYPPPLRGEDIYLCDNEETCYYSSSTRCDMNTWSDPVCANSTSASWGDHHWN